MDCADRIAVQTADRTLEAVRMLPEHAALSAVTVRSLHGRRRFDVTIAKVWPAGPRAAPAYRWQAREVEASGAPAAAGVALGGSPAKAEALEDPEAAYWSAVDAVAAEAGRPRPADG